MSTLNYMLTEAKQPLSKEQRAKRDREFPLKNYDKTASYEMNDLCVELTDEKKSNKEEKSDTIKENMKKQKPNKFKTLLENTLVRFQRSQFLTGDIITFKKGWEKDPFIQNNTGYANKIKEFIASGDNLRVSCTKSTTPGVYGSFGNYENQHSEIATITRETAPGLYIDFIDVPVSVLEIVDNGINLAKVPEDKRKKDPTQIKPTDVTIKPSNGEKEGDIDYSPERQTGLGDKTKDRKLLNKNFKMPKGNKWNDKKPGGRKNDWETIKESALKKSDGELIAEAYTEIYKESKTQQSIPNGTKVIFHIKNVSGSEFGFKNHVKEIPGEETDKHILQQFDGHVAIVNCLATYTELGEKDYEYYDITFEDGMVLHAISGYHLTPVTKSNSRTEKGANPEAGSDGITDDINAHLNESIQAPSEIEDAKEAYIRVSSQIYNGGMEQLINNEGDSVAAVRGLIILAGAFAHTCPLWTQAKNLLLNQLKIWEHHIAGIDKRDQWGNWNPDLADAQEAASAEMDKTYSQLTALLSQIDTQLNVYDDVSAQGDVFGIDRNKNGIKQQLQNPPVQEQNSNLNKSDKDLIFESYKSMYKENADTVESNPGYQKLLHFETPPDGEFLTSEEINRFNPSDEVLNIAANLTEDELTELFIHAVGSFEVTATNYQPPSPELISKTTPLIKFFEQLAGVNEQENQDFRERHAEGDVDAINQAEQ